MPKPRQTEVHPAFQRLLDCAISATAHTADPIRDEAGLKDRLQASDGAFSNWKTRGPSEGAAIQSEQFFGCYAYWVLHGKKVVPPTSTSSQMPDLSIAQVLDALISFVAKLSPLAQKSLSNDLRLLAEAPDSPSIRRRVLEALAPGQTLTGLAETRTFAGKPPSTDETKDPIEGETR